jgi:hypothetical protein
VSPLGRVTAQAALNRVAGSERGSIKVNDGGGRQQHSGTRRRRHATTAFRVF